MKHLPATETNILRIINQEILTNNLDPLCQSMARAEADISRERMIKRYIVHRMDALRSLKGVDSCLLKKEDFTSTEDCQKRRSSRSHTNESKSRRELTANNINWDLWVGNILLAVGTAGAALSCCTLGGNALQISHFLVIIGMVVAVLLLPVCLDKMNVLLYQNGLSTLCILIAIASTGAGVQLLKKNPEITQPSVVENVTEEPVITIEIKPVMSDPDPGLNTKSAMLK